VSDAVKTLWASFVRTIVPIIVGAAVAWLVKQGIPVDEEFSAAITAVLFAVFSSVYYVVVRLLETYVTPKLGVLLGLAKSPEAYTPDSPAEH
jgi:uncharacterized membrane protein (DUF441 family)